MAFVLSKLKHVGRSVNSTKGNDICKAASSYILKYNVRKNYSSSNKQNILAVPSIDFNICKRKDFCVVHRYLINTQNRNTTAIYDQNSSDGHGNKNNRSESFESHMGIACWGFLGFSLKELLGETEVEEKKEDSGLIMMIKRGILAFHLEEYDKSESLLHVALKTAQELQDEKAVTYIFDILANLAYQQGLYLKAEELFKSVLQRHVTDGGDMYDNEFIAVSLKIAHCFLAKDDIENAIMGYHYCIATQTDKLEGMRANKENGGAIDEDTLVLWAMSVEQYAHLLLKIGRYTLARQHLQKVLEVCREVHGDQHLQTAVLRNDIGSIHSMEQQYPEAVKEIEQAIEIAREHIKATEEYENNQKNRPILEVLKEIAYPTRHPTVGAIPASNREDMWGNLATYYINLGSVQLLSGKPEDAHLSCLEGSKLGRKTDNDTVKEEAGRCLTAIKESMKLAKQKEKENS